MADLHYSYVDLSQQTPIARGGVREVFPHPDFDDVLIKVIRADRVDGRGELQRGRRRWKPMRAYGCYISFQREISETLRLARCNFPHPVEQLPIAPAYGIVWTSRGLGLIVQRAADYRGGLAPGLNQLLATGTFTPEHGRQLAAFFQACIKHHIVLSDAHAANIAWVEGETGGRFICIDGIGDKLAIPIYRWSRVLNAWKLKRSHARVLHWLDKRLSKLAASPTSSLLPADANDSPSFA